MMVNFSMYGPHLNAYEFLLKAQHIPEDFELWEDVEVMKDERPGFTLFFCKKDNADTMPFSFGRFIISNKELLQDKLFIGDETVKELSIAYKTENIIEHVQGKSVTFIMKPSFMKLLS